jgi:hypothetical protein
MRSLLIKVLLWLLIKVLVLLLMVKSLLEGCFSSNGEPEINDDEDNDDDDDGNDDDDDDDDDNDDDDGNNEPDDGSCADVTGARLYPWPCCPCC